MKILKELLGDKPAADSIIVLDVDLSTETKTEIEKIYPQTINSALHKAAYELVIDSYPKASTPAREKELPKSFSKTSKWRRSKKRLSLIVCGRKDE